MNTVGVVKGGKTNVKEGLDELRLREEEGQGDEGEEGQGRELLELLVLALEDVALAVAVHLDVEAAEEELGEEAGGARLGLALGVGHLAPRRTHTLQQVARARLVQRAALAQPLHVRLEPRGLLHLRREPRHRAVDAAQLRVDRLQAAAAPLRPPARRREHRLEPSRQPLLLAALCSCTPRTRIASRGHRTTVICSRRPRPCCCCGCCSAVCGCGCAPCGAGRALCALLLLRLWRLLLLLEGWREHALPQRHPRCRRAIRSTHRLVHGESQCV